MALLILWFLIGFSGFIKWRLEGYLFNIRLKLSSWFYIFLIMTAFGITGWIQSFSSIEEFIEKRK